MPRLVNVDNFETVFRKWNATLRLPIGTEDAVVAVKIESLDDFHPDQLYNKLDVFRELSGLRQRLKSTSTFAAAAAEMQSWPGITFPETATSAFQITWRVIPSGKLSDFARLIGEAQFRIVGIAHCRTHQAGGAVCRARRSS